MWSVEKGERPIRLLEASDLAEILGVQIDDFFGDKAAARQEAEMRRLQYLIYSQSRDIREATKRLLAAKDQLRKWAEAQGVAVPPDEAAASMYPQGSRERELYDSLNRRDPRAAVENGIRTYEEYKEGSGIGAALMELTLEEVRNGKHSEEA